MTFLEKLKVIERIDQLIRLKATGTAKELAEKLGVSRSTVFEILNCMKQMGADISYNDYKKSYYYKTRKKLTLGFFEPNQIKGGRNIQYSYQSPIFSDSSDLSSSFNQPFGRL